MIPQKIWDNTVNTMNHHIFGPVASRRLGRSLGIDLLSFKTCTYNCVYCECGATTNLTIQREEFFPPEEIIAELDRVLSKRPELDYITFAGSGEPTLSLSIGQIITYLKGKYPEYRVAVLTNGSLTMITEVRNELLQADLIIPTVSTTSQVTFERIHRPITNLSVSSIIEGIVALREEFSHQIWLEVFLVPLINTSEEELICLRQSIASIKPDRIQLNSLDRPGTEAWVLPLDPAELRSIRDFFSELGVPVDIIGDYQAIPMSSNADNLLLIIDQTLKRRPCTAEDIAQITGLHVNEVMKKIAGLIKLGIVKARHGERGIFYYIP